MAGLRARRHRSVLLATISCPMHARRIDIGVLAECRGWLPGLAWLEHGHSLQCGYPRGATPGLGAESHAIERQGLRKVVYRIVPAEDRFMTL